MKKILCPLLACASLVSFAFAQTAAPTAAAADAAPTTVAPSAPSTRPGPKPGELVPDFTVVGPDGKDIKLSDFRGKTVLIDIWATWCGPCIASMPHNSELAEKYAKDGLVILAICADDSRANYDGWVKRNGSKYKFLTAHDTPGKDGWDKSIFNTGYGVSGFPTLFLVGPDGKLIGTTGGGGPGENPHVTRLLAKSGLPIDVSHLPPEDKNRPNSIPMVGKTMATPAAGKTRAMQPPIAQLGSLKMGDDVADFSAIGVDGQEVKLSSFKGKPVVVAFWTGARAPSDDFAKLYATYRDQGLAIWAINVATDRAEFDTWAKANAASLGYTVSWDPAGKAFMEAASYVKFGIGMYPAFVVVSAEGKFRGGLIGMGAKIPGWTRLALMVSDIKLTPEDKAMVDKNVEEHMASVRAAAPAGGGMGMLPAAPSPDGAAAAPAKSRGPALKPGMLAPDFTAIGPDGKPVKLSDFRGKIVLLDIWGTWCGPCIAAMPHNSELAEKYAKDDLVIFAVCANDTREKYDDWVARNGEKFKFRTAFDPAGKNFKESVFAKEYGASLFPTLFVIDREGKVVGRAAGGGPNENPAVTRLLAKAGLPIPTDHLPPEKAPAAAPVPTAAGGSAMATIKPSPAPTAAQAAAAAARPATLGAGAVAPDFVMQDVTGKEFRLSDFKGKVVILDFWATWCGPCIASFPHTQKVAAKYKDQDVVVVASGTSDFIAKFKEWIPKNQPKYPDLQFYFDPNERGSATFEQRASSKLYGVTGIPTQFVIGRDGKIVATIVGNGGEEDTRTEGALALAGVKVEEQLATSGKAALAAAAEEAKARAVQAAEEAKNPRPPFTESMGKLVAGQPLPLADFTAQGPDGQPVKFSDLAKGKTVVLNIWTMSNASEFIAFQDGWARRYADQGVQFVVLASYSSKEDYDKFMAEHGSKLSFPVLFDPIGRFASPEKAVADMTIEEKKEFSARQREHFAKVIAMQLTGGMMLPVPNNLVLDKQGNLLGFYIGAGDKSAPALGNLLHRAGIKLTAEDLPSRIYTAEETKPKAPPAKVEMIKVGAPAPDFAATDLDGKTVKVSDFRGKVIILDFWAPWCGPCIASMPHTQQVAEQYKDQGVVVLASCTADSRANFERWVKANQAKYPNMIFSHDPLEKSDDRAARKLYGVGGIPQQFIIDREGKIAALVTGYLKGEVILDAALAAAGVKVAPEILEKAKLDQANRDAMR